MHTAIFDIGKTNKKFIIFDDRFEIVLEESTTIPEIKDDDGSPCDDLDTIEVWIQEQLELAIAHTKLQITKLNFSTYGASLVHSDEGGKRILPFYNYLKPYPDNLIESFFDKYGNEDEFNRTTASPTLGMLNSGLQLYWIKHQKPLLLTQVKYSMHFPQYLSYLFTREITSEFTSIGCHTGLWDFHHKDYHRWLQNEGLIHLLPKPNPTNTTFKTRWRGHPLKIGVGIHDSSSALLPYLKQYLEPFLLLSTGTWSIVMNPFNTASLTHSEFQQDCLNFLGVTGNVVRASRLFLGNEHDLQVQDLMHYFGKGPGDIKNIPFDQIAFDNAKRSTYTFKWKSINGFLHQNNENLKTDFIGFESFEAAYHRLILELVNLQIKKIHLVTHEKEVKRLFVDGGFSKNSVFMETLAAMLPRTRITQSHQSHGSALGAAMVMDQ